MNKDQYIWQCNVGNKPDGISLVWKKLKDRETSSSLKQIASGSVNKCIKLTDLSADFWLKC